VPIADPSWIDDQRLLVATYGRGVTELCVPVKPKLIIPELLKIPLISGLPGALLRRSLPYKTCWVSRSLS
jgi:hypothetical protein